VKFLADHMLGKLAKYLRFMGYDTYYPDGKMSDEEIMELAKKEKRIILTRDRELAVRSGGYFVKSDKYEEQLKDVISQFSLNAEHILERCSICNEPLLPVSKEKVKGRVPEYIYQTHEEFYQCPKCGRVYWWGTHTERIEKKINEIIGEANES